MSLSGIGIIETEDGIETCTGSSGVAVAVSIKNVTSKKAKSTIGVISMEGVLRCIFTLDIS